MTTQSRHSRPPIDWAVASKPLQGQEVSGDMHLIEPFANGVLLAAIDGLGHGAEATRAAQTAQMILKRHPAESVLKLMKLCHDGLCRTRGAVMTLASLRLPEAALTWVGVGNVEGQLLRANTTASHPRESVILRGGIVGYHMPALHASVVPVERGDLLILATDGIEPFFADTVRREEPPQAIADFLMARHFKGDDDALVLVVRHLGGGHE